MTNTTVERPDREGEGEDEVQPFRERVRENPRPAAIWVGVLLLLLALEVGRMLSGVLSLVSILSFVGSGITSIPGWIGGNVATGSGIGQLIGLVVKDIVSLLFLFLLATIIVGFVPLRAAERYGIETTRRRLTFIDRVVVTGLLAVGAFLYAWTPVGVFVQAEISWYLGLLDSIASSAPSLTSPELISNEGHRTVDGGWEGTFLGLSPAQAWALRVIVVFAYATTLGVWFWKGYNVFRDHYREADWTPRDDTLRRFRNHYWGLFGLAIVFMFVVLALWAPAVSPVNAEENIYEPYTYEFEYLTEDGDVESVTHGFANLESRSTGQQSVGPLEYDDFDRFHPLGTTPRGSDLFTNLAYGARTSLVIGLTAIGLGGAIALTLSLMTAYFKGLLDVVTIIASDTIISIPLFLLVMMLIVVLRDADHVVAEPFDGGLLLGLILAFGVWPGLWRSIRGPSLQVAEEEWVDAAKSYGQTPWVIMRKHMAPYVAGYMMIYASLLLGSVIIITAALSFLGLGVSHPTPEWGRLIDQGQSYIATQSWHVSTISGIMIVLVVTAFNALGDGIRDAIDPEADIGEDAAAAAGGGG